MKKTLFYKLVLFIFGIMFVMIMALLCLGDKKIEYITKNVCPIPNWILMCLVIVVLAVLIFLSIRFYSRLSKFINKYYWIIIIIGSLLIFVIQCYMAYVIYFYTGWDCEQIYTNASNMVATGSGIGENWYFARYPNNITLLYIISLIIKIGNQFNQDYFLCIVVSVLCVSLSGLFTTLSITKLTKSKVTGVIGWIIFLLVFGFSPWITIPYSDTYSIAIAIIIFYLYITMSRDKTCICRRFIIGLLAFLGMLIKPMVVIVLIAIIIMDTWEFFYDSNRCRLIKLVMLLILGISYILSSVANKQIQKNIGYVAYRTQQFSITHFLMMGLNETTQGVFSGEDVIYTASFDTYEEKQKANIEEAKKRLKDFGFMGYIQFLAKKTLINYNDGTFAWNGEGNFYTKILEDRNLPLTKELRDFYYQDGNNYNNFLIIAQVIWLLVLLSMSGILIKNDNIDKSYITVMLMSIIGITVFLSIFEARARYLICYIPIYVVCATIGLYNIRQQIMFNYQRSELEKSHYIQNQSKQDILS